MPEIKINLKGVIKLLSNLKPDAFKAAGPDSIKPMVLKQFNENGDCPCYLLLI